MENQIQQLEAFQRSFLGVSPEFPQCFIPVNVRRVLLSGRGSYTCYCCLYGSVILCSVVMGQIQQLEAFQRSFLGVSWNLYLFDVIQIV
jgi:hypothetical protein